ncbi:putative drug exporter of the RND superfamily [Streptomyces sp. LamerLS-316]|uniref:MMPL family transporter n=1 Tax=unclassified Streptomyces TaxID=2593676 RepID=UPI0008237EC7|nr:MULTISPECIES: MMPL family transporter [unclassified Streptomyces]MYQ41330.1 MMPL family transporter [Streptomyces sp. SID4921]SCK09528.1 putative drug exporter of the RND superfamily [Streptomyces sp. LamerLS-316]
MTGTLEDQPESRVRPVRPPWRWRHAFLALTVLVTIALGALGTGVFGKLSGGGWTPADAESARADEALRAHFRSGTPDLVLLVAAPGPLDEPQAAAAGLRLTDRLRADTRVQHLDSYWPQREPALASRDGRTALISLRLLGGEREAAGAAQDIRREVAAGTGPLTVSAAGRAAAKRDLEEQSRRDLVRAELIAAPLVLIILVRVFGNLLSALLALSVGGIAVVGTLALLHALTAFTQVSLFAVNLTTALGFGLAVDYGLFIITRHREELAAGRDVREAVLVSVRTAGRTVFFSALTVALSMAALLVFPLYFLRSLAYAGISVAALAGLTAVLVLPVCLLVAGDRVRGRRGAPPPGAAPEGAGAGRGGGFFHRTARTVMRRPLLTVLLVAPALLCLAAPFQRVEFGLPDDRALPASSPVHRATDVVREEFDTRATAMASIVLPGLTDPASTSLAAYARQVSLTPHVVRVDTATGSYAGGALKAPPTPSSARFSGAHGRWLSVVTDAEPFSAEGGELVDALRSVPAPVPALVGGDAAALVDTTAAVGARLVPAAAIIVLVVLTLLFLFTGSVLIPVKALVLNLLSLTATFGAIVHVFQEGHLRALVGDFQVTGTTDTLLPVLMFCIAFGVSMDYEMFLLSRIMEEHRRTGDTTTAVAFGLERTGRLFTAAALVLAITMAAMATSGLTPLKLLGVGLTLAVVLDATLVRMLLVPAIMKLAGRANWWCPTPLRHLHARFGVSETAAEAGSKAVA